MAHVNRSGGIPTTLAWIRLRAALKPTKPKPEVFLPSGSGSTVAYPRVKRGETFIAIRGVREALTD